MKFTIENNTYTMNSEAKYPEFPERWKREGDNFILIKVGTTQTLTLDEFKKRYPYFSE